MTTLAELLRSMADQIERQPHWNADGIVKFSSTVDVKRDKVRFVLKADRALTVPGEAANDI